MWLIKGLAYPIFKSSRHGIWVLVAFHSHAAGVPIILRVLQVVSEQGGEREEGEKLQSGSAKQISDL